MASRLNDYFKDLGDLNYESEAWMAYLRDLIGVGICSLHASPVEIDVGIARRFNFDFFSYLKHLGIASQDYWTHVVINGWKHPCEFGEHTKVIYIIPSDTIKGWWMQFNMSNRRIAEIN